MRNSRAIRLLLGVMLTTFIFLSIVGYSYAYFSLEIDGKGKEVAMSTGDLRLIYKDDTELKLVDAMPGDSVSKVITVNNAGTRSATYSLYWGNLINTIDFYELHVTLECKSYINYGQSNQTESGTCDRIYRAVPISNTVTTGNIKKNISIEPGITQEYTVTVKFDNKNYSQDDNINKTFTGKIGIEEYVAPEVVNCTFDGELTQGAEYVNGQYTYRYMQEYNFDVDSGTIKWLNVNGDGWGVVLTNMESTDPVTSSVCTYINDKPLLYMSNMFYGSQATSIDFSSFNTKNVIDMTNMFSGSKAITLDLSNFDTSNVIDMVGIFSFSEATNIDISSFDTSKVTNMNGMFIYSKATSLDLSNFNTSNVIDMSYMFSDVSATLLDLSNFNTSNVTDMRNMFTGVNATMIDLSNFDTSNVTDMAQMFNNASITSLDISNFNTSKVIDMSAMFHSCDSVTLDVSNFDTSNVIDMSDMFTCTTATILDVSNFDTSKVTNMDSMFYQSRVSQLDLGNFNTSNVTNMNNMFENCYNLITIYVSDKFTVNKVTSSTSMFQRDTKLVGGSGTKYDTSYLDKTYARVDGGTSLPGYFTLKN